MSKKEWELVDKMMVGDFGAYHSEGTPVNDSVVTEDMSKVMDMTYGVFDEDGAWKTINGAHVFIEGGEITKGPAALTGKKSSPAKSSSGKGERLGLKALTAAKIGTRIVTGTGKTYEKTDDPDLPWHNIEDRYGDKVSSTYLAQYKEPGGAFSMKSSGIDPEYADMYETVKYKVGTKFGNISYGEAEKFFSDAPEGTKIKMDNHNTGDYVGEYTKKNGSWVGSQEYKSGYVTPPTVKTAKGFAMQVSGNDLKVISAGSGSAKKVSKSSVDVSKGFPKTVKYDGAEYYKAEEMSGGARSYVRWDDSNNAQYITVNKKGEIERN